MGFVGENLRTARLYRNLTIKELSDRVKVSIQAISQYERGDIAPKANTLYEIVKALKFPKDYFFTEIKKTEIVNNTFFRALFTSKKTDLETQRIKTRYVFRIYNVLNEYLNLPILELPDTKMLKNKTPKETAILLRRFWKLGMEPINDIVSLLEGKGIIVSSFLTESISIDAFTQVYTISNEKQFCVILGNNKKSYVRRNFDAAHELGHILLHSELHDITEFERSENKEIEKQANEFAANFLLPDDAFYDDLINPTKIDSYIKLKAKWKVSIAAMIVRAKDLGRINNKDYQNLYKSLSYKGWRKNEPYDNEWKIQRPQLFKKAIDVLEENDILTGAEFVDELAKHGYYLINSEVESLLDLPVGRLENIEEINSLNNIISIKRINKK